MKNAREARIYVYRKCVAHSLRKRAAVIRPSDIAPDATVAHLKRVKAEMLRLAAWLEAKAARLEAGGNRKSPKGLEELL